MLQMTTLVLLRELLSWERRGTEATFSSGGKLLDTCSRQKRVQGVTLKRERDQQCLDDSSSGGRAHVKCHDFKEAEEESRIHMESGKRKRTAPDTVYMGFLSRAHPSMTVLTSGSLSAVSLDPCGCSRSRRRRVNREKTLRARSNGTVPLHLGESAVACIKCSRFYPFGPISCDLATGGACRLCDVYIATNMLTDMLTCGRRAKTTHAERNTRARTEQIFTRLHRTRCCGNHSGFRGVDVRSQLGDQCDQCVSVCAWLLQRDGRSISGRYRVQSGSPQRSSWAASRATPFLSLPLSSPPPLPRSSRSLHGAEVSSSSASDPLCSAARP